MRMAAESSGLLIECTRRVVKWDGEKDNYEARNKVSHRQRCSDCLPEGQSTLIVLELKQSQNFHRQRNDEISRFCNYLHCVV